MREPHKSARPRGDESHPWSSSSGTPGALGECATIVPRLRVGCPSATVKANTPRGRGSVGRHRTTWPYDGRRCASGARSLFGRGESAGVFVCAVCASARRMTSWQCGSLDVLSERVGASRVCRRPWSMFLVSPRAGQVSAAGVAVPIGAARGFYATHRRTVSAQRAELRHGQTTPVRLSVTV